MPIPEHIRRLREFIGHELLIVPAVNAVILDRHKRVLLIRRSDNGVWAVPGGIIDPGESLLTALNREVMEETGVTIKVVRLTGVYSQNLTTHPNGDRAHYVTTVFRCRFVSGTLTCSDGEALDIRFFPLQRLPSGTAEQSRQRIHDALRRGPPVFA